VLTGDAVHAMPPTAGQGCNMALESSYVLANVLAEAMQQPATASDRSDSSDAGARIERALKKFERLRHTRTNNLYALSKINAAWMVAGGRFLTPLKLWWIGTWHRGKENFATRLYEREFVNECPALRPDGSPKTQQPPR